MKFRVERLKGNIECEGNYCNRGSRTYAYDAEAEDWLCICRICAMRIYRNANTVVESDFPEVKKNKIGFEYVGEHEPENL